MKASRPSRVVAGALLAAAVGLSASPSAIAGMSAPGGAGLSFRGVAPARADRVHAPFNRAAVLDHRARRRLGDNDFGSFDGTGVVPDQSVQEAPIEAEFASATGSPGWAPVRSAGPEIIEIGHRGPRHIHWPLIVYGDR